MQTAKSESYQKGLDLAEAGQYDRALELISAHLENVPGDLEALNDKGAILYCLGRTTEAIELFRKARDIDDSCPQVYWNLTEAHLSADQPELAAACFQKMEELNILNCDLLNRTANAFIDQGQCEPAARMLRWSLKLAPNQEILKPMIEIIQSKQIQS